jgi:hypothetical protein
MAMRVGIKVEVRVGDVVVDEQLCDSIDAAAAVVDGWIGVPESTFRVSADTFVETATQ